MAAIYGGPMVKAYGWALQKPLRKLYYNMTMTVISVLVALAVGAIETLNLIGDKLELKGVVAHFGTPGFIVTGISVITWGLSVSIYRRMEYSGVEPQATIIGRNR